MIVRLWHGWTTGANADAYEHLVRNEIFPDIAAKRIDGYHGFQLLRRALPAGETEFVTLMWFDSIDKVKAFAGEDYERAVVPAKARAVLARFDERAQHYEIRERQAY